MVHLHFLVNILSETIHLILTYFHWYHSWVFRSCSEGSDWLHESVNGPKMVVQNAVFKNLLDTDWKHSLRSFRIWYIISSRGSIYQIYSIYANGAKSGTSLVVTFNIIEKTLKCHPSPNHMTELNETWEEWYRMLLKNEIFLSSLWGSGFWISP